MFICSIKDIVTSAYSRRLIYSTQWWTMFSRQITC